ncbi:MAG TPA: hypothetical protein G4O16_05625 [Dehalococcoidia bacterium]|nr:hypothetical protein [Dehalococcoidia bacterium]
MSTLKVYASPAEFLNETSELLQSDEARYGLVYGIARLTAAKSSSLRRGRPVVRCAKR